MKKRKDLHPSSNSITIKEVIALIDVKKVLADTLKGVEVKGTSYQAEPSRKHPDRVITIQERVPKWVHHYGRDGNYRYQL